MTSSSLNPEQITRKASAQATSNESAEELPHVPPQFVAFIGAVIAILFLNTMIYLPMINAPFLFDSVLHIRDNPGLDQWEFGGTRWLAMASFALDRKLYGNSVWGYHVTSLCVHIVATCLVFWTVYVTLGFKSLSSRLSRHKLSIASFSAILWSIHPLQTEPVLYTVQRMETLMAMFLLAALLMFALALKARLQFPYLLGSALCYLAATGCKEVAIAALPVMFVYDFVFSQNAGLSNWLSRLGQIVRTRGWFYILLALLSFSFAQSLIQVAQKLPIAFDARKDESVRNQSDVIDVGGLTPVNYLTTQTKVVTKYLGLACFPYKQNFDHGMETSRTAFDTYFFPGILAAISIFALYAVMRRWAWGFCLTAFLLILAPTSSVLPIRDLMVEHRMYLPLAFFVSLLCGIFFVAVDNRKVTIISGVLVCLIFTGVSIARVQVYRSGVALWSDSIDKNPDNPRAVAGLAQSYYEVGKFQQSIETFDRAISLNESRVRVPTLMTVQEMRAELSKVQNNYAILQTRSKNYVAAQRLLESAVSNDPQNAAAHASLGNVFVKLNNTERAIECYQAALEIDPSLDAAKKNLAIVSAKGSAKTPNSDHPSP